MQSTTKASTFGVLTAFELEQVLGKQAQRQRDAAALAADTSFIMSSTVPALLGHIRALDSSERHNAC